MFKQMPGNKLKPCGKEMDQNSSTMWSQPQDLTTPKLID